MLIARKERHRFEVVEQEAVGTRLGEGLRESGHLADAAMRRTLEAVSRLNFSAKKHADAVQAIATSALRRADNAGEFAQAVRNITGAELTVLSGDEEARYSFAGALAAHPPASRSARVGVLDVGGGSTEYALGTAGGVERSVSCEIGAVRLTEGEPALGGLAGTKVDLQRARLRARAALEPLRALGGAHAILAVGGTATTAAAIVKNGNRDAADGTLIDRRELAAIAQRLLALPLGKRKEIAGLNPQRADIFPGGIIVIEEALDLLGAHSVTVSTGDLLLGYLSRN